MQETMSKKKQGAFWCNIALQVYNPFHMEHFVSYRFCEYFLLFNHVKKYIMFCSGKWQ